MTMTKIKKYQNNSVDHIKINKIHRKSDQKIPRFLRQDHFKTAALKLKSFSGPSIEMQSRLSNDDTESLFLSSVFT